MTTNISTPTIIIPEGNFTTSFIEIKSNLIISSLSSLFVLNNNSLLKVFKCPDIIYNLCCNSEVVAASSSNGIVHLFNQDFEHLLQLHVAPNSTLVPSPPGTRINSLRISKVDLFQHNLLSLQSNSMFINDLNVQKQLFNLDFTHHLQSAVFLDSNIILSSSLNTVSVVDTRLNAIVAEVNSHLGIVNDCKFNPFASTLFACAGDYLDPSVKLFDLRCLKECVARIDAHYDSVNSVFLFNIDCMVQI